MHSSPHSAEFKNAWRYIPTSPYVFVSCAETGLGFHHTKHFLGYVSANQMQFFEFFGRCHINFNIKTIVTRLFYGAGEGDPVG